MSLEADLSPFEPGAEIAALSQTKTAASQRP